MKRMRFLLPVAALVLLLPATASSADGGRAPGWCRGSMVTIAATNGNDVIYGTPQRDVINGGDGSDTIYGAGKGDRICGGRGDDIIYGEHGRDRIWGGAGKDLIVGGSGADSLEGGGGNDLLWPEGGVGGYADGGGGADKFFIDREGDNDLFGGPGRDTVDFRFAPVGIMVDLSIGQYDTWPYGASPPIGSKVFDVEHVVGTQYDDALTGDAGGNRIKGLGGDDDLAGLGGNDLLVGGPGTDTADGGPGSDSCTAVEFPTNC